MPPKPMAIKRIKLTKIARNLIVNILCKRISSGKEHPAPAIKKLKIMPSCTPTPSKAKPMGIIASTLIYSKTPINAAKTTPKKPKLLK